MGDTVFYVMWQAGRVAAFVVIAFCCLSHVQCVQQYEVDIVELHSEDPESLKERIIRLEDHIEKQDHEITRLRNILLKYESEEKSTELEMPLSPPNRDEEIIIV